MNKVRYAFSNTNIDWTGYNVQVDGQLIGNRWIWRLHGSHFENLPVGVTLLPPTNRSAARLPLAIQNFFTARGVVINVGDTLWDLIQELSQALGQTFHETHCP